MNIVSVSNPGENASGTISVRGRTSLLWSLCERLFALSRRPLRQLRLCETLSLGEKRFVSVIEFEGKRFLVGGTAGSLILLDRLGERPPAGATEGSR
jgi:flagellar biogenesis protein FliO